MVPTYSMRTLPSRKKLAIFINRYIALPFLKKIFYLNLVKKWLQSSCNKKSMRHRKKITSGNNWLIMKIKRKMFPKYHHWAMGIMYFWKIFSNEHFRFIFLKTWKNEFLFVNWINNQPNVIRSSEWRY